MQRNEARRLAALDFLRSHHVYSTEIIVFYLE